MAWFFFLLKTEFLPISTGEKNRSIFKLVANFLTVFFPCMVGDLFILSITLILSSFYVYHGERGGKVEKTRNNGTHMALFYSSPK